MLLPALLLALALLAGCSGGTAVPATPPPAETSAPAAPTETSTPPPTATPGKVILVAGPEAQTADVQQAQNLLTELADGAGLTLETRPTLQAGEAADGWKVVVLLSQSADAPALAAAYPAAQFVVLGGADVQPGGNLSVIRAQPEQRAFLAGYIAALVAPEWRVGGLLPDQPAALADAFQNGARYLCGTCATARPPYLDLPLTAVLPAGSDAAAWMAAAGSLRGNATNVFYVAPEAAQTDVLVDIATQGGVLLGAQTPPDELRSYWAVTITQDGVSLLRDLWPDLLAGQGGKSLTAPLTLADVNIEILTEGRQRLVDQVIADLANGLVAPLSVPLQ